MTKIIGLKTSTSLLFLNPYLHQYNPTILHVTTSHSVLVISKSDTCKWLGSIFFVELMKVPNEVAKFD